MKYVKSLFRYLFCLAIVLIVASIVRCDDKSPVPLYKYTIANNKDSVCVTAKPDTTAQKICSLPAGEVLQNAKMNDEWYEVWTNDSIHGFVDKEFVKAEVVGYENMMGDLEELEVAGQDIAVSIIKYSPVSQKEDCPIWLGVIVIALVLTCIVLFFLRVYTEVRFSIWYDYAITVVNALVMAYMFICYRINLTSSELWVVLTLAAALLICAILLWAAFVKTASVFLRGSSLIEKQVVFNIKALIAIIAFAFSFEEATDIAIIATVVVNIYFLLKHLVGAIKGRYVLDLFAILLLALVCIVPYLALTILAVFVGFLVVIVIVIITLIVLFILGIMASHVAGVVPEETPKSGKTYSLFDADGNYVDNVDEEGRSTVSGKRYHDFKNRYDVS